jgi:hypothetical protein
MALPPQCTSSFVPLRKMPKARIVSIDAIVLVSSPHFQLWLLAAIKWQQTQGFATVQDSSTLQYRVIANGRTSSNMSHCQSTILTSLAAYHSTFTQLWADRVLVHNDLIWTSPPPAHLFLQAPIPARSNPPRHMPVPSPPVPSSRSNPQGAVDKRQRTDLPRADFIASAGIFDLAAPVPADQQLLNYIFDALPPHTSFPKLTNTGGKVDCLLCFCSALPPPNNQCHTASCICALAILNDFTSIFTPNPGVPSQRTPGSQSPTFSFFQASMLSSSLPLHSSSSH